MALGVFHLDLLACLVGGAVGKVVHRVGKQWITLQVENQYSDALELGLIYSGLPLIWKHLGIQ